MNILLVIMTLSALAVAEDVAQTIPGYNTAYNYLERFGIPRGEQIRKSEEAYLNSPKRIIGGLPAGLGQVPYQAGLIGDIEGLTGKAICGATLLTNNRLLTAAHCWYDGRNQVRKFTVVLGSLLLFSGGSRIETTNVAAHPNWSVRNIRNDIAVIYLPTSVPFSDNIAPAALPSGSEVKENFAGESAIASGFGITGDDKDILSDQYLSYVTLRVISNRACSFGIPFMIQPSNICTSGLGGKNTCHGDSGGPLVVQRNKRNVLVGVTSYGTIFGCEVGLPAAYTRVTSFLDFIKQHL